jgi:hypothetical protein
MSKDTARAAINQALDRALDDELLEVSPTEHEISTVELSDLADEEMEKRGLTFATEWQENGSLVFAPPPTT